MTVILHVSDIHCILKPLRRILERECMGVDVVAVTGDIECDGHLIRMLRECGRPVLAVTGNMDDQYIARMLEEAGFNVESRLRSIDDTWFAGVSGREPITSMRRVEQLLKTRPEKLVILAHHPPHGHVDRTWTGIHAGLYEALRLIDRVQPDAYLCGHIHEARGTSRRGRTLIVNPGPASRGYYALVTVDEKGARAELRKV